MKRVAIVGAGVAGCSCATSLLDAGGCDVTLFDLGSRGPGGRASSRPVDGYTFDHAAQFIVARDAAFAPVLQRWLADGVVQPWEGRFGLLECSDTTMRFVPTGMSHTNSEEPGFFGMLAAAQLYVGAPSMRDVCTALLQPRASSGHATATLKLQHRVTRAEWTQGEKAGEGEGEGEGKGRWLLHGRTAQELDANHAGSADVPLGEFDALVLTDSMAGLPGTPGTVLAGPQLQPHFSLMDSFAPTCVFTCMLALPQALRQLPFDAVTVLASASAALQFVSRDSSKPGRARQDGHECWVLVSTEAFAQQQLVEAPLQLGGAYNPQSEQFLHGVARRMLAAFADVVRSLAADAAAGDQRDSSGRDPLAAAAAAENCATLPTPTYLFAQRWGHGYAAKALQLRERCACFEGAHRVVSCGDFCAGGGVDGAALSGLAAGRKLHALLHL